VRHRGAVDGELNGPMSSASSADPTGRRFRIARDGAVAEIAEVGAALRALTVAGVDVVPRYPGGTPTPAASGLVLVPWPNRVAGGSWMQHDERRQLAITEPATGNAIHGLLRFMPYRPVSDIPAGADTDAVTLAATVFPQTGYPFRLDTEVTYRLVDDGLEVGHRITNVGPREAPVALGAHPYLMIGGTDTAALTIELDAATRFEVDDRMIPIGQTPVDDGTDLRRPRRVGELSLDTAFGDIPRDADDRIRARLAAEDGRFVELWAGPGFSYLQVFTTDRYPGQPLAVAVEPMTAPADALNSGQDLHWLESGETWELHWGIRTSLS
jgi:aldose 1-epimerase